MELQEFFSKESSGLVKAFAAVAFNKLSDNAAAVQEIEASLRRVTFGVTVADVERVFSQVELASLILNLVTLTSFHHFGGFFGSPGFPFGTTDLACFPGNFFYYHRSIADLGRNFLQPT